MTTITRHDPKRQGDARFYEIDGIKYPSVTSVLSVINKPALIPWATKTALESARRELVNFVGEDSLYGGKREITLADVDGIIERAKKKPNEVRDAAADIGTRAHAAFDAFIATGKVIVPDHDLMQPFENFHAWYRERQFAKLEGERVVYSQMFGYAGSLDALGITEEGRHIVVDFKTSNGLYPEFVAQVAAYRMALAEMGVNVAREAHLVRFGKDKPEFEAHRFDGAALEAAFEAFKGALAIFRWQHAGKAGA